ncbi:MAG TPA: serine protease [Polyangia bacterium]|nr:serine protease [Polyangia bacterium]
MKLRARAALQGWLPLLGTLVALGIAFDVMTRSRLSAMTAVGCDGEYADSLQAQSLRNREIDKSQKSQFSYLVRSSARYECPFFGPDGKLRRRRVQASELGSAFAYEQSGGDTYLLTNEHVAAWPEVTDTIHHIEGVPEGCKRVEDKLRIVRDERDDFEPGQIVLTRIAVDPLLDAAILKASGQKLTIMPFRVGKSAGLRQGNVVEVRGFPLGVMQAVSSGKVVNPYDRDQEQGWDHVDFVVDALLSEGNSGSPVLAVSCKSKEMELVGIYHAGYKGHGALNVVVGIDQLVDFMKKKKRVPRAFSADASAGTVGAADRARVVEALGAGVMPLFDFGGLVVQVEVADGALLYQIYSRQFPLDDRRIVVIEDKPKEDAFGELGRLWVLSSSGFREWPQASLGPDEHDLLARVADSIRLQILHSIDYRRALANQASADERRKGRDLSRALARDVPIARDLASNLLETAERLSVGRETTTTAAPASDAPPSPPPIPGHGPPTQAAAQ